MVDFVSKATRSLSEGMGSMIPTALKTRLKWSSSSKSANDNSTVLPIADFIMAKSFQPGALVIAGKAGAGKTVAARRISIAVAAASREDASLVRLPCEAVRLNPKLAEMPMVRTMMIRFCHLITSIRFSGELDEDSPLSKSSISIMAKIAEDTPSFALANIATGERKRVAPWLYPPQLTAEQVVLICEAGTAINAMAGPLSTIQNELAPADLGMTIHLLSQEPVAGNHLRYAIQSTTPAIDNSFVVADPLSLVLALSFFSVVRVATANAAYASAIDYAAKLSGGLDEGLLLAIQQMSDQAVLSGGRVFIELRDDFGKSSYGEKNLNDFDMTTEEFRLMGVSHHALYLLKYDKGTDSIDAVYRVRSYTGDGKEAVHKIRAMPSTSMRVEYIDGEIRIPSPALQRYSNHKAMVDLQRAFTDVLDDSIAFGE